MHPFTAMALFCEDIREEKSNLDTIIGILPDNFNVPKIPFNVPKFGCYVRIYFDPMEEIGKMTILFKMTDGSEQQLIEIKEDFIEEQKLSAQKQAAPYVGLIFKVIGPAFPVKEAGRMSCVIRLPNREIIAGVLNIQPAPQATAVATASPQPSGQSPSAAQE